MNINYSPKIKVSTAVSWAGNQSELARRLKITRAAVSKWIAKEKREFVPTARAIELHRLNPELAE